MPHLCSPWLRDPFSSYTLLLCRARGVEAVSSPLTLNLPCPRSNEGIVQAKGTWACICGMELRLGIQTQGNTASLSARKACLLNGAPKETQSLILGEGPT